MVLEHVKCGQGQKALELFQQMQQEGVWPDAVTFVGVANSSASLVAGCVPYTKLLQHDVEEEEKVLHLRHHSKKSAIAFRLINKFTPPLLNTVIRCSSTEKVALEPPCKLDFLNSYCVWIGVVNSQFFRFLRLCSSTEFGLIDLLKNKNYSSKFLRNWIRGLIIKEKLMLDSITSS
jgi:pentatricopeptide repeat protein